MRLATVLAKTICLGFAMAVTVATWSTSARAELLAFFDFNDASSPDVALDISGKGNNGEVMVAEYTGPGGGRTGQPGDQAMDFGDFANGAIIDVTGAADGALDSMVANDSVTLMLWIFGGDDQPVNQWTFYIGSDGTLEDPDGVLPTGDLREFGSHLPWGDANIYFDVAGCCGASQRITANEPDDTLYRGEWNHYAFVKDGPDTAIYQNGELWLDSGGIPMDPLRAINRFYIGDGPENANSYHGLIDDFGVWDEALSQEQIQDIMENGVGIGEPRLQAGDANRDLKFDQLDLVQVQIAAKYLTGAAATWGEGDWDGGAGRQRRQSAGG